MTDETEPSAPEDHPDPDRWWDNILWQSWMAIGALILEALGMVAFGAPANAEGAFLVINVGLVAVAVNFGGGSSLIGFAKAWRGKA